MGTPFDGLLNQLAQQARPKTEDLLRQGFAQPKLEARQELAERLKAHLAHWRKPAGDEIWSEFETGLSEAVASGDVTRLLGIIGQIEGRQAPPEVHVDLSIEVTVEGELPPGAGDVVVSFQSLRGRRRDVVARVPLAGASAVIPVTRLPREDVWNVLPVELGGPFHFALGWIGVESSGEADDSSPGDLVAYDAHRRVVAMRGSFPIEGVRAFIDRTGLPDGTDAAQVEAMLAALAAFEGPVVFAQVQKPTRSLMGFEVAPDNEATLTPGPWPPEHF